ncbi:MAG: hypothetical protein AUJ41_03630 [Candidatus Pacebacteria bacterium CG1_02_43_31]|nr:Fic family protein [Candidatus Pacearchaeota archaeon]NCQ65372.1 Fic family protein [Candidatus Paceibacterota bacterium]OIO44244.1 MAG: hypothetical protein AUJ41_03630 [Candidatus Pacebacteria bacterium CG1_02_43_31]PIQ80756.1 MAG: hypothetical protein COV78_03615 [Candidatus Pacebacteria bacterium CG11_big_fil_rev_8_21_14_0_20_34_55]PJC43904.1 MAG: hypothetical protein CO039_01790 [Candidatus Pacebacteria bacterium CG_4_9_14_0_2_um_filter_34_50]
MINKQNLVNELYCLEKPKVDLTNNLNLAEAFKKNSSYLKEIFSTANSPKYIYWDKFKHKTLPSELTAEEMWLLIRAYRDVTSIETPIRSTEGDHFKWVRLPYVDEKLHELDMLAGGGLFPRSKIPVGNKELYISRGVIEEAIASSQLEGAHTTRAAAKKLILENSKPKNKSEQMILNNYQAMIFLEEEFKTRSLSREMLFELHSILTDKTLDISEQKRFRRNDDEIVVQGMIGAQMYTTHIPPNESFLNTEIDNLIEYANNDLKGSFVHPIIKAIFIHFWVGYLHPFTDGNGRLARALFYWYLLKKDYWTFAYIPISTVIKRSPIQYAMAYIYTEQDNNDLTYFLDYHLNKITQAMTDFNQYIEKQLDQNQKVEKLLSDEVPLNDRQKQLVFYFISEQNASTTTTSHSTVNNISRQTAMKDLKTLEVLDLVNPSREGKYVRYYATDKLKDLGLA